MIGKYDYKFYKKGSIVPQHIISTARRFRKNVRFYTDVFVIGNDTVIQLYPAKYMVEIFDHRDFCAEAENKKFINISGVTTHAAICVRPALKLFGHDFITRRTKSEAAQ
ncbi:hypothetical protein [Enterobacter ludwigii]|uniref:hypothetical protein n=1 Tax=Enterobacter ludwigii TaxID=299767 RepID=UPI002A827D2D|nr:hypothetical protein [Enterobacter ludwigii]